MKDTSVDEIIQEVVQQCIMLSRASTLTTGYGLKLRPVYAMGNTREFRGFFAWVGRFSCVLSLLPDVTIAYNQVSQRTIPWLIAK